MIETAQDKCDSMRASILIAYVDNFVSELDARFAIGSNVLKYVSALNPSSKHFLCPDTINWVNFILEVSLMKLYLIISCFRQKTSSMTNNNIRKCLNYLQKGFSEVLKVFDLVLTLSMTSLESFFGQDSFFNYKKRVKTYLRYGICD